MLILKKFTQEGYYLDIPLKVLTTLTVVTVVVCWSSPYILEISFHLTNLNIKKCIQSNFAKLYFVYIKNAILK